MHVEQCNKTRHVGMGPPPRGKCRAGVHVGRIAGLVWSLICTRGHDLAVIPEQLATLATLGQETVHWRDDSSGDVLTVLDVTPWQYCAHRFMSTVSCLLEAVPAPPVTA